MGFGSYGEWEELKRRFPDYRQESASKPARVYSSHAGGSAVSYDIAVDQKDIEGFFVALSELTRFANLTRQEAIRRGALTIANSLRASTRSSKAFRPAFKGFEPHTKNGHSWQNPIWEVEYYQATKSHKSKVGYRATPVSDKPSKWVKERAISKREASHKSPIYNKGLAKASWFWAASRLDQRGAGASRFAHLNPSAYVDVSERHDAEMSQVTITNRLNYIRKTFYGGEKAPERAFSRASRYIYHYIDRQVQRRIKQGKL